MEFLINLLIGFWPFWVVAVMVIAGIVLLRMYSAPKGMPYRKRARIVTKAELRFYKSLQKAVQDDWEIFAMVRIADILQVKDGTKNRRNWVNKILAKHIDFVLCDPGSLEAICCIELDDSSHERKDRRERDIFVDDAFRSAGLPLVRIPVRASYLSREIRELIEEAI